MIGRADSIGPVNASTSNNAFQLKGILVDVITRHCPTTRLLASLLPLGGLANRVSSSLI